jgi:hypothetical protein
MQESYREGVANHSGPEPCEGSGNAALEALDRGICRLGIELRNAWFRMPTPSDGVEGNMTASDRREFVVDPAESKTPGMQRSSMRENRETPLSFVSSQARIGGRTR